MQLQVPYQELKSINMCVFFLTPYTIFVIMIHIRGVGNISFQFPPIFASMSEQHVLRAIKRSITLMKMSIHLFGWHFSQFFICRNCAILYLLCGVATTQEDFCANIWKGEKLFCLLHCYKKCSESKLQSHRHNPF